MWSLRFSNTRGKARPGIFTPRVLCHFRVKLRPPKKAETSFDDSGILDSPRPGYWDGIQRIAAAMQGLPDDRLKQIHNCTSVLPIYSPTQQAIGYVSSNELPLLFEFELGPFLRGSVICRDVNGFNTTRERLLKNVPTYKLDLDENSIQRSAIGAIYVSESREIGESKFIVGVDSAHFCVQLGR